MVKAALFDLDGTLTDPREGIVGSIQHALSALGVSCYGSLEWCIGPPLLGSFQELVGNERAWRALDLYRERFAVTGLFENEVYAGIPECLQELRHAGIRLYVATSKPAVYAERILEHFSLRAFFAGVYGSTLDGRLTDKGELISQLLKVEGLPADDAVMVGDRSYDAIGAAAAGLGFVGVLYGYGSREELAAAGAETLCETPQVLAKEVLSLC